MAVETIVVVFLIGAAAGTFGLAHLLLRPSDSLKRRPFVRAAMGVLMVPVTGVLAGFVALVYWRVFAKTPAVTAGTVAD